MKKLRLLLLVLPFIPATAWAQNPVLRDIFCTSATGNDTYSCAPIAAITSYDNGQLYSFTADVSNVGTASINFGLGAKTIVKPVGGVTTTLADGDIRAGAWVVVKYNLSTDSMQMVSMLGNASTGGGGTIQSTSQILKGDGAGNAVAASPGSDFVLPTGSITGNAATSSAFDHDPSACPAGQPASDISAAGALTCTALTAAQVTNAFDKSASNTVAAGTQDFSAAAHTLPEKTGTFGAIPATCTVGEVYFSTSATAGQNEYLCTATNTWTQESGGGGGGSLVSVNADSTGAQTLTNTNDTNVTLTIVDSGAGDHKFNLGWTGTAAAARLNSSVVHSFVNDTNITASVVAQVATLGWAGTLAKARQHANTTYTDQANTFGAFLQDFSASTLKMPLSAGCTAAVNGLFCYDSTNNMIHAAQATADARIPQFTVTPSNTHCANWVVSASNYKLGTLGAPCIGDPGGSGLMARTALGVSVARTLTGTTGNVTVTNGDGVSGNPTIDVGATIAQTDQANAFTTGAQDFGAATSLKIPIGAGATTATNGFVAYDSTNNMIHAAQAGADAKIPQFTITPTANDLPIWTVSGSNYKLGSANINQNADGSLNASKAVTVPTASAPTFNSGGTTTCDLSATNFCGFTMTGNTTLVVSNPHGSGPYGLRVTMDGTGGRVLTYPGTFQGFCAPSPTASVVTTIWFMYDGSTNYYQMSCSTTDTGLLISGPERSAAATPATGQASLWPDSTNHILSFKANNSATVSNTVVPDTGASNNFITAISAAGQISKTQPSVSNLSDGNTLAVKATIQAGTYAYCRSTTGNATYTCTLTPTLTAYTRGGCLQLDADFANVTTATVNVDSLGAKSVLDRAGSALAAGAITANKPIHICYDGTQYIIQGDGGGGGGSSTYTREDFYPVGSCPADGGTANLTAGWGVIVGSGPSSIVGCGSGRTTGLPTQAFSGFAPSADGYLSFMWRVPTGFNALVSVTYHWSNDTATKTNVFRFGAWCPASTDSWLAGTATFTDDTVFSATSNSTTFSITNTVHNTTQLDGCSASTPVFFKIGRDGTNGSDNGGTQYFLGVTLRYTVNLP